MPPSVQTEHSLKAAAPPLFVPEFRMLPKSRIACSSRARSFEAMASLHACLRVFKLVLVCSKNGSCLTHDQKSAISIISLAHTPIES